MVRSPAGDDRERLVHRLGERVKELTALHRAASIFQQPHAIPELLQEIVSILPAAWQYPEITVARIVYGGRQYCSGHFRESAWGQHARFRTAGGAGSVDVFYTEARPEEDEGPFLAEERDLINSLAEMLRIYLDRKLAEEALCESEERFRITFEQAAVGIVHAGMDDRILRANQKFCDIVGYSREEVVRRTLQEIACVHDAGSEAENREKLAEGCVNAYSLEKRNVRKDGTPVWVNETVSLVRDPSGRPAYYIHVLEDITERKQSEHERRRLVHDLRERVKELTATYRALEILQQPKPVAVLLPEVVAILPAAWQYPEIAAARIRFDGRDYATPNYVPSGWRQAARFTTFDAFDGLIEVVYLEERPEEDEGPFLAEERDLLESLARILKEFLNRRKAEQALIESERLYHTLADAAHDMVYIIGEDGRFTYFNRYAEDLLGEDPDEYVGKRIGDLYSANIAREHERRVAEVVASGEPAYFEEPGSFPRRNIWTANWLVPIKGNDGQVTSAMCVVRDIDGRKRAEEILLRAEQELERYRKCSEK